MRRRHFLSVPLAAAQAARGAEGEDRVHAYGDGIPLTPPEYAAFLAKPGAIEPDVYSRGGIVERLEARFAEILGKEAAVFLPTGTLANHLAVRLLAGDRRRVLVQAESHLYNDSGDCAQTLSNLNLIPLSPLTLETAQRAAADAESGRVPAPVGALQIETPIRRLHGRRFHLEEIQRLSAWARANRIGRHLDGARLLIECAYTGRTPAAYASLFDTVYVSLYKYLNAASGAILAGPKALLANLHDTRRMFGGSLYQAWPFAAVALHYLDGFDKRFRAAIDASERVIAELSKDASFEIERIPGGTNLFRLRTPGVNAPNYQSRLETAGISTRLAPGDREFLIQVNETWNRVPPAEIVSRFRKGFA
ncbi:MAG: beta-eliminating lyase-related protein [Bryobacteraceae bacterium]|nr:beta-eliminating lyase-related protein [Bryobacteraceae bacterium]